MLSADTRRTGLAGLTTVAFSAVALVVACAASPAAPSAQQVTALREGTWGGQHVSLTATAKGGTLEYDCAHGTVDAAITLDSTSRFDVRGRHYVERPGPRREGDDESGRPARYAGRVDGDKMEITITLTDTGDPIGTFSLEFGKSRRIRKCL
jgi:hypothetical protein